MYYVNNILFSDICGDYDKCVECTNSNCNDSSKFLQNVCNNITSGCICKHGLTGSVCDQGNFVGNVF